MLAFILNILISCNCFPRHIWMKDLLRHEWNKDIDTFFMHFVLKLFYRVKVLIQKLKYVQNAFIHPSSLTYSKTGTLWLIWPSKLLHMNCICSQTVPLPLMRSCSDTHWEVCVVRSCPHLQGTVRTKSVDIGIRCHGCKTTLIAIWKTKMHGRIQLTSSCLNSRHVALAYSHPFPTARRYKWSILSKIRCCSLEVLSLGCLFSLRCQSFSPPSTTVVCSVNCTSETEFKMFSFSSYSPLLPSLSFSFSTVIFWHLCHQPCRITPRMKTMNCPWKSSCFSHLKGQRELKQLASK